jgi:hypothetical protein
VPTRQNVPTARMKCFSCNSNGWHAEWALKRGGSGKRLNPAIPDFRSLPGEHSEGASFIPMRIARDGKNEAACARA